MEPGRGDEGTYYLLSEPYFEPAETFWPVWSVLFVTLLVSTVYPLSKWICCTPKYKIETRQWPKGKWDEVMNSKLCKPKFKDCCCKPVLDYAEGYVKV